MEKAVTFRTIMNNPYREHPPEDALERFLLNQSDEEELEVVETHFLVCELCVNRLEVLELHIAATKLALQNHLAGQARQPQLQPVSSLSQWLSWLTLPKILYAGASLAACTLACTFALVPREVNLVAERGNETTFVSEWVPLHLHLQARDLPAGPVTVRAVSQNGKPIWERAAVVKNEQIEVEAPRLTTSGAFLVEVFSPSAGDPVGDLVKEYSITAKPGF